MKTIRYPLKIVTLVAFVFVAAGGFNHARADVGIRINLPLPALAADVSLEWNYYPELEVYYNPELRVYWYLENGDWVRSVRYSHVDELDHALRLKLRHGHKPWKHHRHHRDYYHRRYGAYNRHGKHRRHSHRHRDHGHRRHGHRHGDHGHHRHHGDRGRHYGHNDRHHDRKHSHKQKRRHDRVARVDHYPHADRPFRGKRAQAYRDGRYKKRDSHASRTGHRHTERQWR